jgi:O-antigen ligase
MFAGLVLSRAVLSVSAALFVIAAWSNGQWKNNFRQFTGNTYYLLLSALFFIPLLSGLWSADTKEWWLRTVAKLPLLLFPLAFAAIPLIKKQQYKVLSTIYILLITGATIWSFAKYITDASANSSYLKAWVINVPFDNDHVRFSWAVVIALLLIAKLFIDNLLTKTGKILFLVLTGWLVLYLHILAAKTGLITLYASAFILLLYKIFTAKNKALPAATLMVIIFLPVLAYCILPTFHNRINYVLYDYQQYSSGNFAPGFPDGARVASFIGGYKIFAAHIYAGVGFGDIWSNIQQWYTIYHSSFPADNRIFPSNELLMYACGAGITGLIVIFIAAIFPFFLKQEKGNQVYTCFTVATLCCFFTDINLEGQHGVFLYCFFAWWLSNSINKSNSV